MGRIETTEPILGRDPELSEIGSFLDAVAGDPAGLILEGEAGIGKTTLWRSAVTMSRQRGYRVLSCRPAESEVRLSFAGLGDLLDVELPVLPDPQQRALDSALLREDGPGPAPDQRAISLATLGVVRSLAESGTLVIAVDDVQWLDRPSARVLAFTVRRLEGLPVGVLIAFRLGSDEEPLGLVRAGPALPVRRLHLGPLSERAVTRMVRSRIVGNLPHPVLIRLHRLSGGNPFFALETARALTAEGTPSAGVPLPIPDDLKGIPERRLAALPASASEQLLTVAAASKPTEDLVLAVARRPREAREGLRLAEEADVIHRAVGRIAFTHPLLGSTVYARASGDDRRRVHRRLARTVTDPEERARHLALGATGPDRQVAAALDGAAEHARARGAPGAAAELAELARDLTPAADTEGILRRTGAAADHHFDAGDAVRSTALLEEAIRAMPPGPERGPILFRLASISWLDIPRVQSFAEQSLAEVDRQSELRASIHEHLAWVRIYRGHLRFADRHARVARRSMRWTTDPLTRAETLATVGMVEFLLGRPSRKLFAEATGIEESGSSRGAVEPTVYTAPRTCYGLQLLWAGDLDAAREVLVTELTDYERRGRYVVRDELLCYLAELECRAGNWNLAARYAAEAVEIGSESGHLRGRGQMLFPRALVAALRGDVDAARADATEGLRISLGNEDHLSASLNGAVLGFPELSLSNFEAARGSLEPVLEFLERLESPEPQVIPCFPDAVEALGSLGRLDEARVVLGRLEDRANRTGRPWAIAAAGRCRGLLAAAQGDLAGARGELRQALSDHRDVPQPFDLARTWLALGEVERRAKQKRAAREALEEALTIFERLGAPLWADRARAALARVGGGSGAPSELTPTEARIAQLVGEGLKNREVADALFVTVKTVEANLSRIYAKLGVRSRTELVRRLAGKPQVAP